MGRDSCTVTESALVVLTPGEEPAEIDVLLESKVVGHEVRIALECRDHGRRGDKNWVEQVLGKYSGSEIRPIMVHSKGFTSGAKAKASRCGITLLTLSEANEHDWLPDFLKATAFFVSNAPTSIRLHGLAVLDKEGRQVEADLNGAYICQVSFGTIALLSDFARDVGMLAAQEIVRENHKEANEPAKFTSNAIPDGKVVLPIGLQYIPAPATLILARDITSYPLHRISITYEACYEVEQAPLEQFVWKQDTVVQTIDWTDTKGQPCTLVTIMDGPTGKELAFKKVVLPHTSPRKFRKKRKGKLRARR